MFRTFIVAVCLAHTVLAQEALIMSNPGSADGVGPLPEAQLYANIGSLDQFAAGYGANEGGRVERIDQPPVQLPTIEEVQAGQDQTFDHQFPDVARQNRVDNTKEINTYTNQQRIVTVNNRNLHRYLKNLLVNTQYNTNIAKINHSKLQNLLVTNLQETHQPKLLVKYSRQDTVQDLGQRDDAPIVTSARRDNVLPAVIQPAVAEKIGYDGLGLGQQAAVAVPSFGGRFYNQF